MRISTLPLFIALLVASPLAAAQRPVAHDAKLEAAVDAYLRPLIDLHLFQGAVLIARGDQVVFEVFASLLSARGETHPGRDKRQVQRR